MVQPSCECCATRWTRTTTLRRGVRGDLAARYLSRAERRSRESSLTLEDAARYAPNMPLAIVGALAIATASLAADQWISASKIEIRRSPSGAEKLIFTSRDPSFLFPAIGGADDPSTAGATITVVSPLEAPVTFSVPAGIGKSGGRVADS